MCLPADLLTLPKHLQSWLRFGVDLGVATTETEYTKVLNGGISGGRGLPRLGGHATVQRILRTRHEHPGVIIAAHETRVREDLMTLPGEILEFAATREGSL